MNENFSGMNSENRVFRPVNSVFISGANNRTYIYSTVNSIQVNGLNQLIYCNYVNSRVNSIKLNGMNNTVYINRNSNLCVQDVSGANNRIILTDIQNDNNHNISNNNNNNNHMINSNNNIQNRIDIGAPILNRNLEHSAALIRENLNINNSNLNLNHDYPSAPINMNVENEFIYEKRYEHENIIEDEKCNICNIKFNNNDIIKSMQCGHIYHKFCLDKFLERQINRDNNTPLCLICFQWEMQDNINRRNA